MRHVSQAPVDNKTHGTAVDDTCDPEDWQYESDQDGLRNLHEGHFVQQHGARNEPLIARARVVLPNNSSE